ncbi:MAG: sigma-54 dependent transcriptional regulator [Acidobacteriota bacterium]
MARILVVDDEENIGRSLRLILEREGHEVAHARSAAESRADRDEPDLVLLDVRLPDGNGVELLRERKQRWPATPVLIISGQATIADAVEATRAGAFDFIEKPLSRDRILVAVRNALEQRQLRTENERLRTRLEETATPAKMIGEHAAFLAVVDQATMAARSDARVLITGESGTGKELLAAHIHAMSPFADGPFVKVNCAAIPAELVESELFGHERGAFTGAASARKGKFELAHDGSIFLDEVGDLPLAAQAKLLRVLQEGEMQRVGGERTLRVKVRVIAATNRDLAAMARRGEFREDLYYRLCVVPLRMPALRERSTDIPSLAGYFLEEFCTRNNFRQKSFGPETLELLSRHIWQGNARELRNAVERMAILTQDSVIGQESVPLELRETAMPAARNPLHQVREDAEREQIRRALWATGGNVSASARMLGLERTNLHKRIKALGLARDKQEATATN